MPRLPFAALLLAAALSSPLAAQAPLPERMTFQGRLTNAAGNPVTGSVSMTFSIYAASSGGTPLWTETQSVPVSGGLYSAQLGAVSGFSGLTLDMTNGRWLGIAVGADPEMTPRYPLSGAPYARRALSADSLGKFSAEDFARLDETQTFTGSNTFSGPVTVTNTATFTAASTLALSGSVSVAASGAVSFASGARLYLDAGTAASPGLAVNGDRNTGLFSPANDTLSIATGGAERLRVNATGLVGIGLSGNPAERLDVDGNVQATGEFQYASPRTFHVNVPGPLFRSTNTTSETSYVDSGGLLIPTNASFMSVADYDAGISLPHGAVVKGITVYVYDDDTDGNVTAFITLKRRANTSLAAENVTSVSLTTSGQSTSVQQKSSTLVNYPDIDTSAYQYHLHANFASTASMWPKTFYGCRVEYTLRALRP